MLLEKGTFYHRFFGILDGVLIWLAAILFNQTLSTHGFISRSTYAPAATFILFSSLLFGASTNFAAPIGLFFGVLSIIFFMNLMQQDDGTEPAFMGGFFLAMSSIFLPIVWPLLFINMVVIISHKSGAARLIALNLITFLFPYFFIWTGFLMYDHGYLFLSSALVYLTPTLSFLQLDVTTYVSMSFILISLLLAITFTLSSSAFLVLKLRLWYRYFFWMMALAVILFSAGILHGEEVFMLGLAISPTLSKFLEKEGGRFWPNLIFNLGLLLACLSPWQFFQEFFNLTIVEFF